MNDKIDIGPMRLKGNQGPGNHQNEKERSCRGKKAPLKGVMIIRASKKSEMMGF